MDTENKSLHFAKVSNYVGGALRKSMSQRTLPLYNPNTGEQTGDVILSTEKEVKEAVDVAKQASQSWALTSPLKRARVLMKFLTLVEKNLDYLAEILSSTHGKVFSDAQGEIIRGKEVVEFAIGIPHLLKGEHSFNIGTNIDSYSIYQPLGVVAGITPFNFPAMVPMWMYPIAIACGNSFILKPSEKNPQISLVIAQLLKEAGLPDGVFNVINGDKEVVDSLLTNPDVHAVSFVGSTPIAEYIYQKGTSCGKRIQALGGAKNHLVVMEDADLEQTTNALMGAAYGSAGERCMAISVVVAVGDKVGDSISQKIQEKLKNLVVGYSLNKYPESEMGPLVTQQHLERVRNYVGIGVQEGAKLVVDGRNVVVEGYEKGFFLGGCLFDNVKPSMKIYKEEIFGPVLVIVRVNSYDEAVELINNHEFANGTSIFTRNGGVARSFTQDIQVGMVGVNVPIPVPMAFYSFGGWKKSLFGVQHIHGKDGIRFYTRMKTMTTRWSKDMATGNQYAIPTIE